MKTLQTFSCLLYLCFHFTFITNINAERLSNSPYPVCSEGLNSSFLFVIDDANLSEDEIVTVQTFQGWTSRFSPLIFRKSGTDQATLQWLDSLVNLFDLTTFDVTTSIWDLISLTTSRITQQLTGYVLYSRDFPDSINAAISLCSTGNLIAIEANLEEYAQKLGLKKEYDVSNMTQVDVWYKFGSDSFSRHITSIQSTEKAGFLADYSVFAKAFTWYPESFSMETNKITSFDEEVLDSLSSLSAIMGWGPSEDETVKQASQANGSFVHASDYAKNLATLTNFDIPQHYQKDSIFAELITDETVSTDDMHTICFLMTDGDNIQWILNTFAIDSEWWGSSYRGDIPLGWTISPALTELAPSVMQWLYNNSTRNDDQSIGDFFVAAPSGIGYTYPDQFLSDTLLKQFAELTSDSMAKADLQILNVIADNWNETYAQHFAEQSQIDGIFWYEYSSYVELNGQIIFIGDKPVIGGRYQLWDDVFDNVTSIIQKLQAMPKTPYSSDGYSLIPVHV